jgi:hypothetical protein
MMSLLISWRTRIRTFLVVPSGTWRRIEGCGLLKMISNEVSSILGMKSPECLKTASVSTRPARAQIFHSRRGGAPWFLFHHIWSKWLLQPCLTWKPCSGPRRCGWGLEKLSLSSWMGAGTGTVLYMHWERYPSEIAQDHPFDELSMMSIFLWSWCCSCFLKIWLKFFSTRKREEAAVTWQFSLSAMGPRRKTLTNGPKLNLCKLSTIL